MFPTLSQATGHSDTLRSRNTFIFGTAPAPENLSSKEQKISQDHGLHTLTEGQEDNHKGSYRGHRSKGSLYSLCNIFPYHGSQSYIDCEGSVPSSASWPLFANRSQSSVAEAEETNLGHLTERYSHFIYDPLANAIAESELSPSAKFTKSFKKKLNINMANLVQTVTTPIIFPNSGRKSEPRSLAKHAEVVMPSDIDEQESLAYFPVYKVSVVTKVSTGQLLYKYKTTRKNEVVLRMTLKGISVLEDASKLPLQEYSYRQLSAITLKDTGKESRMKIVTFELILEDGPIVAAFATFQSDEILLRIKNLMRKARYAGYV